MRYHRIMDKAWQAQFEPWIARVGDVSKLVCATPDGIAIYPLYGQGQGLRAEKAAHGPWRIFQRIEHWAAERANAQALEDLEGGATGLALRVKAPQVAAVLQGVMLHAIEVRLEGDDEQALAFARFVASQPVDPARLRVSFCRRDAAIAGEVKDMGFEGPILEADGRKHHDQGASEAQELAAVLHELAMAVRKGVTTSAALAANQDMFLTMAKFRALRLLWARLLEASGISFAPLAIHGETSRRMMAELDPHANILRATAACFGAALGGADSISVLPYSIAQGLPDAHARRVARNTQLVLLDEAQLWRVDDPASGSGYVEALTDALCQKAWDIFRGIEASGRLPDYDQGNAASEPIIGVKTHRLAEELPAAVEPAT
jgi:methylmalonyl-CoA mutase